MSKEPKTQPPSDDDFTLWNKFLNLDQRFPWSFLGWVLGVIGVGCGIYFGFFYSRIPALTFDVLSNTNIVDLSENQGKLDILYSGKSIKSAGNALSVITLRIENSGNAALRPDSFTPDAPLGFVITEGEMVEAPQVIGGSNDYLKQYLKPSLHDKQTAYLAPVIIQAGESVTLKALVIHQVTPNTALDIKSIGVVADVDTIPVKHSYLIESEQSSWNKATTGGPLVQFQRLSMYGACYALITFVFYSAGYWRGKVRARRERGNRHLISSRFVAIGNTPSPDSELSSVFARMLNLYEANGLASIQPIRDALRHFVEDKVLSPGDRRMLAFASIIDFDPSTKVSTLTDPLKSFVLYDEFVAFVKKANARSVL